MTAARNLSVVSRRQFLASSGIGAMLGSGVGASLLASELGSDHPILTIYRSTGLFAMLIEHQSARVLLLDGDGDQPISEAAEGVAGFLRQRLDVVLASDGVLRAMSADFVARWNVSAVFALPDKQRPFTTPLDYQALEIGDLQISAIGQPIGAWRSVTTPASRPWRLSVRYGSASCIYSDSWDALMAVGHPSDTSVTLSITGDSQSCVSEANGVQIVAIPEDSLESLAAPVLHSLPFHLVRLYRNYPIQIHLRPNSIILPNHG